MKDNELQLYPLYPPTSSVTLAVFMKDQSSVGSKNVSEKEAERLIFFCFLII